uniref:Uncharacterized protein n=1 Tax=Sphaerodactylus townsendi TaxID=933632 RepID=A0ACB8FLX9_9SAUR
MPFCCVVELELFWKRLGGTGWPGALALETPVRTVGAALQVSAAGELRHLPKPGRESLQEPRPPPLKLGLPGMAEMPLFGADRRPGGLQGEGGNPRGSSGTEKEATAVPGVGPSRAEVNVTVDYIRPASSATDTAPAFSERTCATVTIGGM